MVCPICQRHFAKAGMRDDHCHVTGLSRERICNNCNLLLGLAGDSPEVLKRAGEYVRYWQRKHRRDPTPLEQARRILDAKRAEWDVDDPFGDAR